MNRIKKILKYILGTKSTQVPNALIGTIIVTMTKRRCNSRVHVEYRGHKAVLVTDAPTSTFDVFKHGNILVKIGNKRHKVNTKEILNEVVVEHAGNEVKIRYRQEKKKLTPDDFVFVRVIGKGTYGKVVLAKYKNTGRMYACKIIKKTNKEESIEKLINEKNILTQVSSPFVIHLLASFQTQTAVYLILPYIEGGELFQHLQDNGQFSEEAARIYICELVTAVAYLHENGIIYRDIKPENILLDRDGHIVLCDFGMCTKSLVASTYCGTSEYIAPEIIRNERYTESVDYYTIGVLLYEMVCGNPPFVLGEDESPDDLENRVLFSEVSYPEHVSDELRSLLGALLSKMPNRRPTIDKIMAHAFFAGIDWEKVKRKEYAPAIVPGEMAEEDESIDTAENQNSTYEGMLTGFTYCPDDWDEQGVAE